MSVERMEQHLLGQQPGNTAVSVSPQSAALEAQAKAVIFARYEMALRQPRNWERVRADILRECSRPRFAADPSVLYSKPVGGSTKVDGLGIRFVEMALRCLTNVATDVDVIYEDAERRVLRVTVTNLESNQPDSMPVTIMKTVERSHPGLNGTYLAVRTNSQGKLTYLVNASEDELQIKEGALIAKMRRNLGLRHIPADLQQEAEEVIRRVRSDRAARDPDAERREITDGFAKLNVSVEDLEDYLGHPVHTSSPGELVNLRTVWGTIADGETSWAAIIAQRRAAQANGAAAPPVERTDRGRRRARPQGVAGAEASLPAKEEVPAPEPEPVAQGVLMVAEGSGQFLGRYHGALDHLVVGGIMEIEGADFRVNVVRKDRIVLLAVTP